MNATLSPQLGRRPGPAYTVAAEDAPGTSARRRALAERIAAVTRAAYTGSDPLPALPPPDGSQEGAHDVERDLAAGQRLWVARDSTGSVVGALRTADGDTGREVRRVAVLPGWRGLGLAQALLAAVERAAVADGFAAIHLDAVVERCLPPLYERLGFVPVRAFRAGDKPLTEWHMRRELGVPAAPAAVPARVVAFPAMSVPVTPLPATPVPVTPLPATPVPVTPLPAMPVPAVSAPVRATPAPTPATTRTPTPAPAPTPAPVAPGPGLFLCWFVCRKQLLVTVRRAPHAAAALAQSAPVLPTGAALAGVDLLPGATPDEAGALLRHLPAGTEPVGADLHVVGRPRTDVLFHVLPRSFDPRLMSLTRHAPGRELPLAVPGPTENE
ncbi:GNAT family N-acetyltransferase [Streptomyces sp. NPDC058475]|uniref:GNAT family N-acetyltransferase n=1 Tax=Streptomyces sp. NPDC058475 TaxID=3346518 RepID=UPI00365B90FA